MGENTVADRQYCRYHNGKQTYYFLIMNLQHYPSVDGAAFGRVVGSNRLCLTVTCGL